MIIIRRAVGTALCKRNSLLDIALDQRATADAALLVSGVAVIGYLWDVMRGVGFSLRLLLAVLIYSLMDWILMAGITLLTGKMMCKTETSMSTIMRLQGFSHLPLVLTYLTGPVALAGRFWFLVVLVVATNEALETVYWRAVLTVVASLAGWLLIRELFWGVWLF